MASLWSDFPKFGEIAVPLVPISRAYFGFQNKALRWGHRHTKAQKIVWFLGSHSTCLKSESKMNFSLERSYPKSNSSSKTAIFAGDVDIVFCFVLKFIIPFAKLDILFVINALTLILKFISHQISAKFAENLAKLPEFTFFIMQYC